MPSSDVRRCTQRKVTNYLVAMGKPWVASWMKGGLYGVWPFGRPTENTCRAYEWLLPLPIQKLTRATADEAGEGYNRPCRAPTDSFGAAAHAS